MRLNEFAQKNFMRLENNTAEMQMRESNLPQARVDLRNRILLLVITLLILAAVALFGLAVLLVYICVVPPTDGTGMGAIRDVLRGLGGSLAVALPLVLVF